LEVVPRKQANPIDGLVGNRVRLRRTLLGMSQERLGELLSLTFQQVQKYEKGVNRIGAGRLFDISRILEVPITYFYEDVQNGSGGRRRGFAEESGPAPLSGIPTGEALQLSTAFGKIRDTKVRKRVLDLVKALASEEKQR
jgi:transcriptional regulator with XRE-family HTH domain